MIVYIKIIGGDHKSEGRSVQISISPVETIAALKAIYVNTGHCPTPTSISLRFNGQILQDEKTLKDYEIADGNIIYHFTYNMVSYFSQDYNDLSNKLRKRAKNIEEGSIWESKYDQEDWNRSMRHHQDEQAIIKPEPPPQFKPQHPGRILARTYICTIGHCKFESYQKMEGRWNGTISVLGNNLADQGSVCSVSQIFDPKGYWIERRSITHPDGVSTIQEIKFTPVSSGRLNGEVLGDKRYTNHYITMKELENDIFIMTYFSKSNKLPLMVETITLVDDYSRIRSQQQFDNKGNLLRVYVMNEQRVIDEISGAVTAVVGGNIN